MALDEFNLLIDVITGERARHIREMYIQRFVNTQLDGYKDTIATKTQFKDGEYYVGYLWDYLISKEVVIDRQIFEILEQEPREIYVFWDLHSSQRIFVKDYWKYPRDAVLSLLSSNLPSGLSYLPQDIYIVDHNFTRTFVLTHEELDNKKRWCLETDLSNR